MMPVQEVRKRMLENKRLRNVHGGTLETQDQSLAIRFKQYTSKTPPYPTSIPTRSLRTPRHLKTPGTSAKSPQATHNKMDSSTIVRDTTHEFNSCKKIQDLFSFTQTLIHELNVLKEALGSRESAERTCQRVEESLARRLATTQSHESCLSHLVEQEKTETECLETSIEATRKKSSALSREIMRVNQDTWNTKNFIINAEEHLKLSEEKQLEKENLLPLLRRSCCNAVEDILDLESCLDNELLSQAKLESLMHLIAKDIRFVCRMKNPRGGINQEIRVALTPPSGLVSDSTSDQPLEKTDFSKSSSNSLTSSLFDVSFTLAGSSSLPDNGVLESTQHHPSPPQQSQEKKDHDQQQHHESFNRSSLYLPVSGCPTCSLKMKPLPASTHISTLPTLNVPFDRIIEYDPGQRPHELLVTDWQSLQVPDVDDLSSILTRKSNLCVDPDVFEDKQVNDLTSTFVEEFFQPLVSNGFARPKTAGIISIGSHDSSHLETFWGNDQPSCVVQKPVVCNLQQGSSVKHECERKKLGLVQLVSRGVFKAQHLWQKQFPEHSQLQKSAFSVEVCVEAMPLVDDTTPSVCTEKAPRSEMATCDEMNSFPMSSPSLGLSKSSADFLRSLNFQQAAPGMSLHREQEIHNSLSLSPNRIFQVFPPEKRKHPDVPRLHFPSSQPATEDMKSAHNSIFRTPRSARQPKTTPLVESDSLIPMPRPAMSDRFLRVVEFNNQRTSLEPTFKPYTDSDTLLKDVEHYFSSLNVKQQNCHTILLFKVSCYTIDSISGVTERIQLLFILGGFLLPTLFDPQWRFEDKKLPQFIDPTLNEVLNELLLFPKNSSSLPRTASSSSSLLWRKKKPNQRIQMSFTLEDDAHRGECNDDPNHEETDCLSASPLLKFNLHLLNVPLPNTPLGKLLRYVSLSSLGNVTKMFSESFPHKPKEDKMFNDSTGCLVVLSHMLYPKSHLLSEYAFLKAIHHIIQCRSHGVT